MLTVLGSTRSARAGVAAALVAALLAIAVSLTAYPLPAQAQASTDATLSALTVSPKNIIGFAADRTAYEVGVASTAAEAAIKATANDVNATVAITPPDSNNGTVGHQVALSAGRNKVTITVIAQDSSTYTYTVNVNQGVTDDFGGRGDDDLDGLITVENTGPFGIWGNEMTLWVADPESDKLYAYNRNGTHNGIEDFDTLAAVGNTSPIGI